MAVHMTHGMLHCICRPGSSASVRHWTRPSGPWIHAARTFAVLLHLEPLPSFQRRQFSSKPQKQPNHYARPHPLSAPGTSRQHRTRRDYHSYDHPSPSLPFSSAEKALLEAAYQHVPEQGFSQQALAHGARDAGYPDISPSILPGDGVFALIRWHLVTQRLALAERKRELFGASGTSAAPAVGDAVEALAWARLQANRAVIHRWQEALAVMAQPSCAPAALRELALLADEILFLAGDKAVDPSWYAKRAALSAVYASTELFMTNDRSDGFAETRAFLRRRLDESSALGSLVGSVGQWVGFTMNAGVNVLRSKGVRI